MRLFYVSHTTNEIHKNLKTSNNIYKLCKKYFELDDTKKAKNLDKFKIYNWHQCNENDEQEIKKQVFMNF